MATERSVSIVPLTSRNYATWKIQCQMGLIKDGIWNIVNGEETAPADADQLVKFNARKDRALAIIVLSLDPSLLYLIGNDPKEPVEVWKRLQEQFQKKSWANKLSLRRKLYSLRLDEKGSVQEHIRRMTEIFTELSVVGDEVAAEDQVVYLLASLPDSFNMLVTALEANATVPVMEVVTERLIHEEKKLKDKTVSSDDSALYHQTNRAERHYRRRTAPRRSGPRCHYCNKYGHIQRNCRDKKANSEQSVQINKSQYKQSTHKVAVVSSNADVGSGSDSDVALAVTQASKLKESTTTNRWIVDSGATCHICNDERQFTNLVNLKEPIDITLGDGHSLKVFKEGVVEFKIQSPSGKIKKCVLSSVLYTPELSYNLFSVSKATQRGATVTFDDNKCSIFDKNKPHTAV